MPDFTFARIDRNAGFLTTNRDTGFLTTTERDTDFTTTERDTDFTTTERDEGFSTTDRDEGFSTTDCDTGFSITLLCCFTGFDVGEGAVLTARLVGTGYEVGTTLNCLCCGVHPHPKQA